MSVFAAATTLFLVVVLYCLISLSLGCFFCVSLLLLAFIVCFQTSVIYFQMMIYLAPETCVSMKQFAKREPISRITTQRMNKKVQKTRKLSSFKHKSKKSNAS